MRMKRTNGARAAEQVPKREKERVREAAPHSSLTLAASLKSKYVKAKSESESMN